MVGEQGWSGAAATSLLLEAVSVGPGGDAMKESDLQYDGKDVLDWVLELERVHGGGEGIANTKLLSTSCPNPWECISFLLEIST
jgi:hypothetical protein